MPVDLSSINWFVLISKIHWYQAGILQSTLQWKQVKHSGKRYWLNFARFCKSFWSHISFLIFWEPNLMCIRLILSHKSLMTIKLILILYTLNLDTLNGFSSSVVIFSNMCQMYWYSHQIITIIMISTVGFSFSPLYYWFYISIEAPHDFIYGFIYLIYPLFYILCLLILISVDFLLVTYEKSDITEQGDKSNFFSPRGHRSMECLCDKTKQNKTTELVLN